MAAARPRRAFSDVSQRNGRAGIVRRSLRHFRMMRCAYFPTHRLRPEARCRSPFQAIAFTAENKISPAGEIRSLRQSRCNASRSRIWAFAAGKDRWCRNPGLSGTVGASLRTVTARKRSPGGRARLKGCANCGLRWHSRLNLRQCHLVAMHRPRVCQWLALSPPAVPAAGGAVKLARPLHRPTPRRLVSELTVML